MEFKQLEAFVAVVDYGSFSEAARRLYLTQPTISAHIRSLEDELQRTKQLLVFPLEEAAHKRSFYIVYSKNRILKPHVKQFVQFVRDYYM